MMVWVCPEIEELLDGVLHVRKIRRLSVTWAKGSDGFCLYSIQNERRKEVMRNIALNRNNNDALRRLLPQIDLDDLLA